MRKNHCEGERYGSFTEAARAAGLEPHSRPAQRTGIYKCEKCKGWHISRGPQRPTYRR